MLYEKIPIPVQPKILCLASGSTALTSPEEAFQNILGGDAKNAIRLCKQFCINPCSHQIKLDSVNQFPL